MIFGACKRQKGIYKFEGTLTDNTFSTPYANAEIKVSIAAGGSAIPTLFDTYETDADGNFSFEIERGVFEEITIEVEEENYFSVILAKNLDDLSIDEPNVIDLTTTAKSWININFNNPNGDPSDQIEYTIQEGKDCNECCDKSTQTLTGNGSQTIMCVSDANTFFSLYYVFGTNDGIPGVQTVAFDTVDLDVNY